MKQNRRDFLRNAGACGLAVAGCGLLAPGCLLGQAPVLTRGTVDAAGQINLGTVPELAGDHTAVVLHAAGATNPILVVHLEGQSHAALSAVCTHAACTVTFDAASGTVECPCHRSAFDVNDGHVLRRPATEALPVYGARVDDSGALIIELRGGTHNRYPVETNNALTLDLSAFPELAAPGGSIVFTPFGYAGALLVARIGELDFIAAAGSCTFAPCVLGFDFSAGLLRCPCHGCSFQLGGEVASGPATVNVKTFSAHLALSTQEVTIALT